jgi:hypothetical protein
MLLVATAAAWQNKNIAFHNYTNCLCRMPKEEKRQHSINRHQEKPLLSENQWSRGT